jgi:hypothetical protein
MLCSSTIICYEKAGIKPMSKNIFGFRMSFWQHKLFKLPTVNQNTYILNPLNSLRFIETALLCSNSKLQNMCHSNFMPLGFVFSRLMPTWIRSPISLTSYVLKRKRPRKRLIIRNETQNFS